MLRESTKIPLARAVETPQCRLAESSARGSAQCATAASLRQLRNPARNTRCGNRGASHHPAHKHPLPQTDPAAALSLLQRTSSKLPASCHSGHPKSSPSNCSRNVETVLLPVLTSAWV